MAETALKAVIRASLDGSKDWPVAQRILIYRGLAEICGDPDDGLKFLQLANDLAAADERCRAFAFEFNNQPHK